MTVAARVTEFKGLIWDELNEEELIKVGDATLSEFRQLWKQDSEMFRTEDTLRLREISEKVELVRRFNDEVEEIEYVSDRAEADKCIGRLYDIVEGLKGLKVAARVEKEIRGLVEKRGLLPERLATKINAERQKSISALNASAPSCKKCGKIMVIREAEGDYFWGCSTFPTCWSKKRLSVNELNTIPD